ncbi:DotI/IcmL family type IV secretion protein [Beijerinckia indica]|uniref:Intracellular multiplication protein IcmL n=1 Tax=Beijerinckia indica subsp. indica (strain ATCC 9039 / DSM 1715 / NCIMB 8712) TaxID=395963 RepID=B2ILJ1_BEII9|nr:DotI/IcmL family type IV secretion protein [Beijerinckia indica]ACB97391.1 hypothetical protein Bind_3862 [Beijerinckia indica subsp. indica ATCC 9039]
MQNQRAAVMRRLSDPDFQASLVNKSIMLVMGMFVMQAIFVIHDVYVWMNPPQNKFFIVDGKGPPHLATPLSSPVRGDREMLAWTVDSILGVYNLNYHDYPVQLTTAGRRFTQKGWISWADSYKKSGNFDTMKQAMLLCDAQAQRAAIIRESTMLQDALAYRIEVPIVQTCRNSQQTSSQNMLLTALVVRTNSEDYPDGLAIEQLVARPM